MGLTETAVIARLQLASSEWRMPGKKGPPPRAVGRVMDRKERSV